MSIKRYTTELLTPQRRPRRRDRARRGWLVQRLEQRCVMAADLGLGSEPAIQLALNDGTDLVASDVSSEASSGETLVQPESAPELTARIDLFSNEPIELQTKPDQLLVLHLDTGQLDALLGQHDSLALHVVYDATRWQSPAASITSVQLLSLIEQTVHLHIAVQPGEVDSGSPAQITIKLSQDGSSNPDSERWLTDELELVRSATIDAPLTTVDDTAIRNAVTETIDSSLATLLDPTGKSDIGGKSVGDTSANFDSGNFDSGNFDSANFGSGSDDLQSATETNATPLPESHRTGTDRSSQFARRTLDIRAPGANSWSTSTLNGPRAPVSPSSLQTQRALASVYDVDVTSTTSETTSQSRWLLEPKGARMQVAVFLLRRAEHSPTSTVAYTSRADSTRTDSSRIDTAEENTTEAKPTESSANEQAATPNVNENPTRVASVPSTNEVTTLPPTSTPSSASARPQKRDEQDSDEVSEEASVYASIVDRLLGSPVSLVAILGLTIVARLPESDETAQRW